MCIQLNLVFRGTTGIGLCGDWGGTKGLVLIFRLSWILTEQEPVKGLTPDKGHLKVETGQDWRPKTFVFDCFLTIILQNCLVVVVPGPQVCRSSMSLWNFKETPTRFTLRYLWNLLMNLKILHICLVVPSCIVYVCMFIYAPSIQKIIVLWLSLVSLPAERLLVWFAPQEKE